MVSGVHPHSFFRINENTKLISLGVYVVSSPSGKFVSCIILQTAPCILRIGYTHPLVFC